MTGDFQPARSLTPEEEDQACLHGIERARAGDYAAALVAFIRCAESGYRVGAAFAVAQFYERGPDGVPKDLAKAEHWYRRAIAEDSGYSEAKFHLAKIILVQHRMCTNAFDRERTDEAITLLDSLAEEDDPYALIYLGELAIEGIAVSKSFDRAEHMFSRAADQGFVVASIQLSRVAFAKGQYFRAIGFRLRAAARAIALFAREPNDKRLFLMHQGVGMNRELPGWMTSEYWPRF